MSESLYLLAMEVHMVTVNQGKINHFPLSLTMVLSVIQWEKKTTKKQ